MKSPVSMALCSQGLPRRSRGGYTIVEMLVATALTLVVMAAVVSLFGSVTDAVSDGQAMMETVDRVRSVAHRLQLDLKYATARMVPPLDPAAGLGYFEIIEGPGPSFEIDNNGQVVRGVVGTQPLGLQPINSEVGPNVVDTSVGDVDDVLMFTARSYSEPFVGIYSFKRAPGPNDNPPFPSDADGDFVWGSTTAQSQVAEIAWFLRGTTLYRRVLLVGDIRPVDSDRRTPAPAYERLLPVAGFYGRYDVSAHLEGGNSETRRRWGPRRLVPNTLGDLTKRENRYGHQPHNWPHSSSAWRHLGLPTLRESSHGNWPFPLTSVGPGVVVRPSGMNLPFLPNGPTEQVEFWNNPHPWSEVEPDTGTLRNFASNSRVAEDVILTNVISFDVKVRDDFAPVFRLGTNGVLSPGDPGYRNQLKTWVANRNPAQVASFGAYVDLYYARGIVLPSVSLGNPTANPPVPPRPISLFSHPGFFKSGLSAVGIDPTVNFDDPALWNNPAVYDTYSTHYDRDGVDQFSDNLVDLASDGVDNNNTGGVDDESERETSPPYPAPLRSVQIKIRVYEPDSRQVREVTVTQDFLK